MSFTSIIYGPLTTELLPIANHVLLLFLQAHNAIIDLQKQEAQLAPEYIPGVFILLPAWLGC